MNQKLRILSLSLITLVATNCFAASSSEIRDSISKAIDSSQLGRHEIEIEVRRATVTLNGFVGSETARRQVEEIATNTAGVEAVDSRLRVEASGNSIQQELARNVWNNIQAHNNMGTYKIQIVGHGDKVVLTGSAASNEIRTTLEMIARQTAGVQAVENQIIITG